MNQSNPLLRHLGIAFLFTLTAVLTTVIFWPICQWFPPALFLLVVLVSSWQGGMWQGLATTGFGLIALLFVYRNLPGDAVPTPWLDVAWRLGLFGLIGVMASYLSHQCRRALTAMDRVHDTLTSLGDGLIFADSNGRIHFLNPAAEAITGWKRADALEQPLGRVFRCLHEDGRQPYNLPLARVLSEGATIDLPADAVLLSASEKDVHIEGRLTPHREQAEAAGGILIAFRDVSKRRQEDRECRRREEQFRALAGYAPACILFMDQKGSCLSANAAWQSISGLKADESQGEGWARVAHPHDRQRLLAEWQGALRGGRDFAFEFRMQPRQGETRWMQVRSAPMLSQRGQLLGHVAVVEDIDARRQGEASLRAAENRATAFMRNFPGLACLKDAEGRYVYVNDLYAKAFGWEPGDWEGKTDEELLPQQQHQPFCTQAQAVLESLEDHQSIERFDGTEGEQSFLIRQFPVEGACDEEILFGAMAVDLTAQKHAEESLQKAREEFERRWQERAGDLKRAEEAQKKARADLERLTAEAATRQKQADEALRNARQELEQRTADLRKAEKQREELQRQLGEAATSQKSLEAELESVEEHFSALIDEQAAEHNRANAGLREQLEKSQGEAGEWRRRYEATEARTEPLRIDHRAALEELTGVHEEATQLRIERARCALERDLFAAVVAQAGDSIFAFDRDMRCTVWNVEMEQVTSRAADQTIGRSLHDIFPALANSPAENAVQMALTGRPMQASADWLPALVEPDATWTLDCRPMQAPNGEVLGGIGVVRREGVVRAVQRPVAISSAPRPEADPLVLVPVSLDGVTNQIVVNSWRLVDAMETWHVREHAPDWLSYN